jgi:hypothetical protein
MEIEGALRMTRNGWNTTAMSMWAYDVFQNLHFSMEDIPVMFIVDVKLLFLA